MVGWFLLPDLFAQNSWPPWILVWARPMPLNNGWWTPLNRASTPDTIIGWLWCIFNDRRCSFQHRRRKIVTDSHRCPFRRLIGWLWGIVDAQRCLFHSLRRDFVIDSQRCPIQSLLGRLSRRVSSPTTIPLDTPIHFNTSTDTLPFLILDYGGTYRTFFWL